MYFLFDKSIFDFFSQTAPCNEQKNKEIHVLRPQAEFFFEKYHDFCKIMHYESRINESLLPSLLFLFEFIFDFLFDFFGKSTYMKGVPK